MREAVAEAVGGARQVTVRPRTLADLDRCAALLVGEGRGEDAGDGVGEGHAVVGHVALTDPSSGDCGEVVFVAPEARGAGAGRRLVEAAMVRARVRGLPLVLDVMVKDRAAIRLYERLGWRHIGDSVHHGGLAGETPCRWYAWDPR